MILKSKLLILIPILTIFSNNALAELRHYPIGNSQVRLGIDHSKSVVTDFRVDGQRFSGRIIEPAIVEHMPSGARASAKVPLTIEASVSRKAVLSGAFGLVKRGAALGTRLSGWGTAAYFAYEAYQAVKSPLESEGYKWNEAREEFLKEWPARNCIWITDKANVLHDVSCYGVDSSIISAMKKGGKSESEAKFVMQRQMEELARSFWEQRKKELDKESNSKFWEYFNFRDCQFDLNGGSCFVNRGNDVRVMVSFRLKMRDTEVLTNEKFLQISTPSIDANPTPFVHGTGKPEYQENIKVPAGTVVTIGPVETPEGKKTYTVTFTNPNNGGSSEATVQTR